MVRPMSSSCLPQRAASASFRLSSACCASSKVGKIGLMDLFTFLKGAFWPPTSDGPATADGAPTTAGDARRARSISMPPTLLPAALLVCLGLVASTGQCRGSTTTTRKCHA